MQGFRKEIGRFGTDRRGTISLAFGLSAIMLMVTTGLAIDGSRAYFVSNKVGDALDSAALAAARIYESNSSPTRSDVQEIAQRYFDSHVAQADVGTAQFGAVQVTQFSSGTVEIAVAATVPTVFGGLMGIRTFTFQRTAAATFSTRTVELSMVLDVTGSMCDPGTLIFPRSSGAKLDGLKSAARDLIAELYSDNPPAGSVRVGLVPYAAAVNLGPNWSAQAAHSPHGDHCVVEREGSHAYTDAVASGSDRVDSYNNLPMWVRPLYSCPSAPLAPLTDLRDSEARSGFETKINNLTANGWTAGHIGAAWGWYTVSDAWASFWPPAHRPRPHTANAVKAVLLMTDGIFNTAYRNGGENYITDPDRHDRRIAGTSAYQAEQLCNAMKAQNIRIYAIMFIDPADPQRAEAQSLLEECARSSGGGFYEPINVSSLRDAFRDVAKQLAALRITR